MDSQRGENSHKVGKLGFSGGIVHRFTDTNCWNIDLLADLAEVYADQSVRADA